MEQRKSEEVPHAKTMRHRALWILLVLLLAGLSFGGWRLFRLLHSPSFLFTEAAATASPGATPLAPAFPVATAIPDRENTTPAPADAYPAMASPAPSQPAPTPRPADRLNVMLMGIDAYENGSTSSGTMPHTDVMMVIAVNFSEDRVDLITLPRDILTTAPGHYGFYKLNGVFNVGLGGWKKPKGKADELADGFLLTCRAAEEWLGGVSIPYYYAVDFQAVVDIVNAIGGIDYDVDQPFTSHSGRRRYGRGMRHLDGDAVLGYLRIRTAADGLDSSRTARQRRMMVAIFEKLKTEGRLSQIPALIAAANSGIYTNTTLGQTTALANYAMQLDADRINTRSMFGEIGSVEYEWRYVYVDQQNRIDLIREVFGMEASPVGTCTRQYERWLHTVGFSAMKYMRQAEKVLARIQERKDAGEPFSEEQIALYGDCYQAYTALRNGIEEATDTLSAIYASTPWREKKSQRKNWTKQNTAEDKKISATEAEIQQRTDDLKAASREATRRLADSIGFGKLSWSVGKQWYYDPDINEVKVNFG